VPALSAGLGDDVVHVGVARGVLSGQHHVDGALRYVHAPDLKTSVVEANGGGKAHVTKPDDADCVVWLPV